MIPEQLRIQPGQEALTPEQEAEAQRFAEERIAAQFSTEPIDEPEAERLLRQAYVVANLPPPQRVHWVDGPLYLVAALAPLGEGGNEWVRAWSGIRDRVRDQVWSSVGSHVLERVWASMGDHAWEPLHESVRVSVAASMRDHLLEGLWDHQRASVWRSVVDRVQASARAYSDAPLLAYYRFFAEYLTPNALHALACFNEQVSGYWLGHQTTILVRRPRRFALDAGGRLHCATGKSLEYHDGWGVYAWHGMRVPEQVILAPEQLTREDYLTERNLEVRRVIQERMGKRFVTELGGNVIDTSPRGTLYEVRLPEDDPERVARYVQVQDASTPRHYFLRVPPTVRTVAEAVAWSFQVGVEDYHPAQET